MSKDIQAVTQLIQTYFDGLHEGDTQKLGTVFHELCNVYSINEEGGVRIVPRTQWLELVASRPSPKSRGIARTDRIVTLDMTGPEMAIVKVELSIHPRYYTDCLTLLRSNDGGWKVVSKTFRMDVKE
ncbi:nuclear transport factor 2 family protein [Myxococcaceae bacterium JPH2]|nr:nuclear transport factor 2 family protein [Myxococcaceae bacterium JPH2]